MDQGNGLQTRKTVSSNLTRYSKLEVPKCSWTHACLSRMKKGIVTPWDRQIICPFDGIGIRAVLRSPILWVRIPWGAPSFVVRKVKGAWASNDTLKSEPDTAPAAFCLLSSSSVGSSKALLMPGS